MEKKKPGKEGTGTKGAKQAKKGKETRESKSSSNPALTKPSQQCVSLALCVLLCHEFTAFLLFGLFFWIRTGPIRPYLETWADGRAAAPPSLTPTPPPKEKHAALCSPLSKIQLLCNKVCKNIQVPARSAWIRLGDEAVCVCCRVLF